MRTITTNEWLAALKSLSRPEGIRPGQFSIRMVAAAVPCGVGRARAMLRAMIDAGRARCDGFAMQPDISGRQTRIPVYRLAGKGGKK